MSCHTNSEVNPWFQVDLGAVFHVGMVAVMNRDESLVEFKI